MFLYWRPYFQVNPHDWSTELKFRIAVFSIIDVFDYYRL